MDERFVEVDGRRFRVVLKPSVPFRGAFIACRGCTQLGKPMTVRHVDQVFDDVTWRMHAWGSPDWQLAANTFRREHQDAGPLCEECRAAIASAVAGQT